MTERTIIDEADELARAGRPREAIQLVEKAAIAGDPVAEHEVAQWRLFGLYGQRDHQRTCELLASARSKGHLPAARLEATLIGNGSIGPADPDRAKELLGRIAGEDQNAAAQLAMLDAMPPPESADQLERECLSEDPPAAMVRDLFGPAETDYLIAKSSARLQPSFVIDPRSGRRVPHPIRTSSSTNFGPADEDLVVHALNRRIAAASSTPVENGEMLQILRYEPGQEYRPHLDAVAGLANQREWTVLVWLNEDYEGGETIFPDLDISARGRRGDALIFRNSLPDGEADERMRHAGSPVTRGAKWLASRWIRMRAFSPWDEPPA